MSDYYNRTWLANWRLWYKKAEVAPPVLIEADHKVAGQEEEEKKSDLKDLADANCYEAYNIISENIRRTHSFKQPSDWYNEGAQGYDEAVQQQDFEYQQPSDQLDYKQPYTFN